MPLNHKDFIENDIMQILALLPEDATMEDRVALMRRWQAARIKEFGWVGDFVAEDPTMPYGLNAHTHGLAETHQHPDLQVVFNLPPGLIQQLLTNAIDKIKEGVTLEPGVEYDGIISHGYKVTFVVATEGDREVLRMIVPGKDGKLSEDEIDPDYKGQYDGTRMSFQAAPS